MTDPSPDRPRVAALDIGSLTVRLAIAEIEPARGSHTIIYRRRVITHLGQGVASSGALSQEAMEHTLAALAEFGRDLRAQGVKRVRAVGTQACRQAADGAAFLDRIKARTGLTAEVITPEEEAGLTLTGVLSVLAPAVAAIRPLVVFDLGGGSTEFARFGAGPEPALVSLPLGALSLTQTWLRDDPPAAALEGLRQAVAVELARLTEHWGLADMNLIPAALVGTAGTVTTLAAISLGLTDYDPKRVNNLALSRETIDRLTAQLASQSTAQRARTPGLEPGKAGVIVAGAVMVQAIMTCFRQERLVVSDAGLLEGVLQGLAGGFPPGHD